MTNWFSFSPDEQKKINTSLTTLLANKIKRSESINPKQYIKELYYDLVENNVPKDNAYKIVANIPGVMIKMLAMQEFTLALVSISEEIVALDTQIREDENALKGIIFPTEFTAPYYLFFDTETTGIPTNWKAPITDFSNWPRVVQLAWILYDANGNFINKKDYIIQPEGFIIPAEASQVHGITTEYAMENGEPLINVLDYFEEQCKNSTYLVAHNINFDSKVLGCEFLRILSRNPISELNYLCTMESSVDYCKIESKYGYKWPKLSELHIKLFGEDFEGAHNALADIEATAKCFWKLRDLKLM
jgi:DNA polymerase-3 subunit epsilon